MSAEDRVVALRVALDLLLTALREGDAQTIQARTREAAEVLEETKPRREVLIPARMARVGGG